MYNFYINFNFNKLLPFNLKKKKLKIHGNFIGYKRISKGIDFFSITGLKGDSNFLDLNFSKKKLSVFFISKFNMVESKWLFPISYYYNYNNSLLKYKLFFNNMIFIIKNSNNKLIFYNKLFNFVFLRKFLYKNILLSIYLQNKFIKYFILNNIKIDLYIYKTKLNVKKNDINFNLYLKNIFLKKKKLLFNNIFLKKKKKVYILKFK